MTKKFNFDKAGAVLLSQLPNCQNEIILVSPYIKKDALKILLRNLLAHVEITVITKWSIRDFVFGASDVDFLEELDGRKFKVYCNNNLHSKIYILDSFLLMVGSANLTMPGMGLGLNGNHEIVFWDSFVHPDVVSYIGFLMERSVLLTDDMVLEARKKVEELKDLIPQINNNKIETRKDFGNKFPKIRNPEKLFDFYSLSEDSNFSAMNDLRTLNPPEGLDKKQFEVFVSNFLMEMDICLDFFKFISEPKRYGQIRRWYRNKFSNELNNDEVDIAVQPLLRWLLYFLPGKIGFLRKHYTEVYFIK
jgi:hypothetical protein